MSDPLPRSRSSHRDGRSALVEGLRKEFHRLYGREPRIFFAPGRVNLIGAHLDYNGGRVLPVSVASGTFVAVARGGTPRNRLASLDAEESFELDPSEVPESSGLSWAAYPAGVWLELREFCPGPYDLLFGGNLPLGAGLSSSASIEVATGFALTRFEGRRLGLQELAEACWRAETSFVGVQCGIMDPYASALCRQGQALLLDCRRREFRHVPIHGEMELFILDTRKPRGLLDSEFNQRVDQCRQAHALIRRRRPDLECLADARPCEVEEAREELGEVLFRRARHVATESGRMFDAARALEEGDLSGFGRLLRASHESSRLDYEVSCPELDHLVREVCRIEGVFGARLTGAGFGGCVVALERPGAVGPAEEEALRRGYEEAFGSEPGLMRLALGDHPREIRSAW